MRDMEREGERARPLGQKNKGVHAALRGRAKLEKLRREREREDTVKHRISRSLSFWWREEPLQPRISP
ncbi:hypothetical protein FA10DRAFT_184244 [Acaromyces ingoldii]|uniref:Uncharacterized protein n=1 Tax=Acaromyces ingoldii TaxID=215250 RepID=A0A316YEU2_9BASI|nr:hypothetical protein FA10DRAFT_184244 [Acaromyces ingoldii]PWN87394.1 hypothetical protein FA10DRAFT_184244 [Acaromyces ingoldii]